MGESPKFSSEFSSGRAVAPLRGRALPGLYAERTDYRLSTIRYQIRAAEMQTGPRGGLPSNDTPEAQPTADANTRSDGAREISD